MQPSCDPCASNVFTIYAGDDKTMMLRAAYQDTGLPLDLTSCTEISVPILNAGGTSAIFLYSLSQVTIGSPTNYGLFSVPIPSAKSALFFIGELQTFDVTFTIAGLKTTVRYFQSLSVLQR